MKIKEFIDIINVFDVDVIFDNPKDVMDDILQGALAVYFTPIEGIERETYLNSPDKESYISSTQAIHIPNLELRDFVNIFECDGTGIHDFTLERIGQFYEEGINKDIVYASFIFLHEVGHWMQFKAMGNKVEEFVNSDVDLEKENFEKVEKLNKQREDRIARGSECVLTANEKKLFMQYMHEYRDIPKEKAADQFALENIKKVLEVYRVASN